MNEQEQKAIIGICILAAIADGLQGEAERTQIQKIASGFSRDNFDLTALYQDIMLKRTGLAELAQTLQSDDAKALAYEMAVCVCHADGTLVESEREFLTQLREEMHFSEPQRKMEEDAANIGKDAVSDVPPASNPRMSSEEIDRMILNYSILNGGLELMPQTLATLAIIPVQMRMVFRIGKQYGYELGKGHIKDFLGTVGIGLSAQVLEGFANKLVTGLFRQLGAGGILTGLSRQGTSSAFAFATTYALGQVAKQYYSSGRTLDPAQLKQLFASFLQQAKNIQSKYSGDMARKSQEVNTADLTNIIHQQS